MTIHPEHPFLEPERDPVRRSRGRLGGAVTLLDLGAGEGPLDRAGLTVTSVLVANGEPARLLALLDPDSDLAERLEDDRPRGGDAADVGATGRSPRPSEVRRPPRAARSGRASS